MVQLAVVLLMALPALSAPTRAGVRNGADEPGSTVYYIMTSKGDSLYVRGSISTTKDIAQKYCLAAPPDNAHIDFDTAYMLAPTAAYTLVGMRDGPKIDAGSPVGGNTDAAPITTNNFGACSGPHGLKLTVYHATHGKASADLCSEWTDGTHNFILTEILNSTTLLLYSVPYTTGSIWTMSPDGYATTGPGATLTHVRGAADPGAITRTSANTTEERVITRNATMMVLANGTTAIASGDAGYASFVDVVEEWDVINPATLDTTNFNDPWDWTDGSVMVHVKNTHRLSAGSTVTRSEYDFQNTVPVSLSMMNGTLVTNKWSSGHAARYFYLPGIKSTGTWKWSDPQRVVSNDAALNTNVYVKAESLLTAGKLPDRFITLFEAPGSPLNYDLGFSVGYAPVGDGSAAVRLARIPAIGGHFYCFFNESEKMYPNFKGRNTTSNTMDVTADSTYDVVTYRQFFDQSQYSRGKYVYWNTADGYEWVYIDYHAAAMNDTTALPARMVGRAVSVVDTLNVTIHESVVPSRGITITTTPGDTLGYAVLRLSTLNAQADDPPPAGWLSPPVPNPSNKSTTMRYAIATTGRVRLGVYDLGGRVVRRLVDEEQRAGPRTAVWNGTDESGAQLRPGVYFVRLAGPGILITRKVVLVR